MNQKTKAELIATLDRKAEANNSIIVLNETDYLHLLDYFQEWGFDTATIGPGIYGTKVMTWKGRKVVLEDA